MADSKNPILHTLLSLVSDQNTLTVHRAVVEFLEGNFEAALLLEQLLYWTPRAGHNDGWIAKSYTEWQQKVYLTRYGVEKARKYLKARGLLEWEIRRFKNSPTAFYRVNLGALARQWEAFIHEREAEAVLGGGDGSEETEKAPAEISRWSEEAEKAPVEISKWSEEAEKPPAEISKWSEEAPAENNKPPADFSRSLTEITTEITQLNQRKVTAASKASLNREGAARTQAAVAAAVAAEVELPEDIVDGLKALGWRGPVDEVVRYWQEDPDRVENLLWYAQQKGWGAGLLRNALRSGEWPPELKPDSEAYRRRYREGPYAAFFEGDGEIQDKDAGTPSPDVGGGRPDPGDSPPDMGGNEPESDSEIERPASAAERNAWELVLGQLQMEMPRVDFDTWVRPTQVVGWSGEKLLIGVLNPYARRWLEERLTSIVQRKLAGVMGQPVQVRFVVTGVLEEADA